MAMPPVPRLTFKPRSSLSSSKKQKRSPLTIGDLGECSLCPGTGSKRQKAVYVCPRCNVHYCSLECYRLPSHSACLNDFLASQLALLRAGATQQAQGGQIPLEDKEEEEREKGKVLEMLKRIEEDYGEEGISELLELKKRWDNGQRQDLSDEDDSEEEAEDQMSKPLAGIDLDSLNSTELLALLSPQQQLAFSSALAAGELDVDTILAGEESLKEPWWMVEAEAERKRPEGLLSLLKAEDLPVLLNEEMRQGGAGGRKLRFNLLAVILAYAYILRHLSLSFLSTSSSSSSSEEEAAANQLFNQLVPFLLENNSTLLLLSVEEATEYVVSRLGGGGRGGARKQQQQQQQQGLRRRLLEDAGVLFRRPGISEQVKEEEGEEAPSHMMRALGDIDRFFSNLSSSSSSSSKASKSEKRKWAQASRKIRFYAVAAAAAGGGATEGERETDLEREIQRLVRELRDEEEDATVGEEQGKKEKRWRAAAVADTSASATVGAPRGTAGTPAKIVEL